MGRRAADRRPRRQVVLRRRSGSDCPKISYGGVMHREMSDRMARVWQDYCSSLGSTFGRTSRMKMKKKAAVGRRQSARNSNGMIDFSYANVSYQIDTSRRK